MTGIDKSIFNKDLFYLYSFQVLLSVEMGSIKTTLFVLLEKENGVNIYKS